MNSSVFLASFLVYVVAMIAFGCWMTRHKQSGEDFLLGGRALPLLLTLGTTVATMVGTGSSMGAVGKAYQHGWTGAFYGVGGTLGIFVAAWLFAPARRHRFMTMGEELSSYVGANASVKNLVSLFIYLACVGWLGAHILGGGKYLEFVTGMDPTWAKLWIALGFGIYSVIGGYRAVVWTDSLQAIVLFAGFLVTAFFAFETMDGWYGLQRTADHLSADEPAASGIPSLSLVMVITVGVLGTPSFRQRIYSGSSVSAVRKAFVSSGVLYLGFAALPAIIGMAAFHNNPELRNGDLAFPYMATEVLPPALGIVILLAGLSATMSSASSDAIAGVTTLMRDVSLAIFGRVPPEEKVVAFSRVALAVTIAIAFAMAAAADNIIGYIADMIALFITGLCVCGVLGRLWPRYNWLGAIASLVTALATAILIRGVPAWNLWWGNPVIPSLCVSAAAGIAVSLVTRPDQLTHAQAVAELERQREAMERVIPPNLKQDL